MAPVSGVRLGGASETDAKTGNRNGNSSSSLGHWRAGGVPEK